MTKQQVQIYRDLYPELDLAVRGEEVLWLNDVRLPFAQTNRTQVPPELIEDAEARWQRFAPYLEIAFPETRATGGIIESELRKIGSMQAALGGELGAEIEGRLLLKMDSHLPISGSVKARGGLYEVLKHAETLALESGLLQVTDNYAVLASEPLRSFFAGHTVQVGSTGNLGLSIGIISAKLGFRVIVHMSADAKQWKKDLLRSRGVTVVEYQSDYCAAVEQGRMESEADPTSYFVDDEKSVDLFLGYSVAAGRLKAQLDTAQICVDATHPLFVYLPCGIGGAPGGVAYGLRQIFGDHVHCFFTEPTDACCMLMGMATGLHDAVSVTDFGISGKTEADGLAVNRPSAFVGRLLTPHISGIATIADQRLYRLMELLMRTEDIFIEPSACASFAALLQKDRLAEYLGRQNLTNCAGNITHLAWATGGSMVPQEMREQYLQKALQTVE